MTRVRRPTCQRCDDEERPSSLSERDLGARRRRPPASAQVLFLETHLSKMDSHLQSLTKAGDDEDRATASRLDAMSAGDADADAAASVLSGGGGGYDDDDVLDFGSPSVYSDLVTPRKRLDVSSGDHDSAVDDDDVLAASQQELELARAALDGAGEREEELKAVIREREGRIEALDATVSELEAALEATRDKATAAVAARATQGCRSTVTFSTLGVR